jgi:hypothetical protein
MLQSKTLISIFILLATGLHAVPVLLDRGQRQIAWPFLVWSMYKNSRPPGPVTGFKTRLYGVNTEGKVEEISPRVMGLSWSTMGRLYYNTWAKGDTTAPQRLIADLNRVRQDSIVEVRLSRELYMVSDTGLVRNDPPVLSYRLQPSKSR